MKKITDSFERTAKLKIHFRSLFTVLYGHVKNKITRLGLGSNFKKYFDSLPDDLFHLWKFGEEYGMHSSEGKSLIRQAMEMKPMKDMIQKTIKI